MMYDRERIGKILSDMERYFSDLDEIGIKSIGHLSEKKDFVKRIKPKILLTGH